jgi:hypothetical protein
VKFNDSRITVNYDCDFWMFCVLNVWSFKCVNWCDVNHLQMHKESFIINRNTLLHVSTLLGHLQGELSVTVTLGLLFTVEWECAVDCVLRCFWRRELSAVRENVLLTLYSVVFAGVTSPRSGPQAWGPDRGEFTAPKTTQYTVNSTFSLNCKVQP